ncbi:MAG: gmhA [Sphingobacterium sp.]|jgi:D-sedoheptulose 7-phosphate isomerase|nr:gmhA [Sphingobacterium sp.]
MNFDKIFIRSLKEHEDLLAIVREKLSLDINRASEWIAQAFSKSKKLMIIGNGGSASDAQHIAAEFTGRFLGDRIPLPAISLTTDTSALTAIANDFGYEHVFSRQIAAIGNPNDVLMAISTSGKSKSVINAINTANMMGIKSIGLSGNDGGFMKDICQLNIIVESRNTARIQEMHILIGHILCEYIDYLYTEVNG